MNGSSSAGTNKKRITTELPVLGAEKARPHSRNSRWRAGALLAVNMLIVAHIIQWRLMGETVTPVEPSEAMYTLQTGAINAGFIFFSLAIAATLVFGRFVCGWGCHVLALQDLCAWLLKKVGLRPRPFRSRLLVYVPLVVALYMFVWPTVYRWIAKPASQPLFPNFTTHLTTTDFWATFPPVWVAVPFLFVCGFATVYFLGSKGFCTYGCPYGGFFGVADKFAPGRIRVTDACSGCGECTATCTSNVIVHAEVKQYGMVTDPGCMKCMDCVSVCPNDALYFGFGKPAAVVKKTLERNHSLTWGEEIFGAVVFMVSFLAVWDVYQIVPMLMALGIAGVTTFLALRLVKLFRSADLSFYKWNLRHARAVSRAGWAFIIFAGMWIGWNAHSGVVRYLESAGNQAFEGVKLPDELALAQANPGSWLSAADREAIEHGRSSFQAAAMIGVLDNTHAVSKHAWLEYLSGNTGRAIDLLDEAASVQEGRQRALSLYYRGAILNRLNRGGEALSDLDLALADQPSLAAAAEERGEALWRLGRREEAVESWRRAVVSAPKLSIANHMLAGASAAIGERTRSAEFESIALANTPPDALFHWMIGQRLQNIGMAEHAEKSFARAIQLNPQLKARRVMDVPLTR